MNTAAYSGAQPPRQLDTNAAPCLPAKEEAEQTVELLLHPTLLPCLLQHAGLAVAAVQPTETEGAAEEQCNLA